MSDIPNPEIDLDAVRQEAADAAAAPKDREIAFLRAGINTGTALGDMVMRRHTGDLTAEAIKATEDEIKTELGIAVPAPGDPGTPEAGHQGIRDALTGGAPAGNEPPPVRTAEQEAQHWYQEARKAGHSIEDSQVVGIGSLVRSAAAGDKSMIFDADAWDIEKAKHGHGAQFSGLPDARVSS